MVELVGRRLAGARDRRVVEFQRGSVIAECEQNMDETDARLISVDNRMCNFPHVFELLNAAFYCRYLVLESGGVFRLAACSCSCAGRLVSEALVEPFHHALLREHPRLPARDGGIDSCIFPVATSVEGESQT